MAVTSTYPILKKIEQKSLNTPLIFWRAFLNADIFNRPVSDSNLYQVR
jgi:hypothetical protein